MDLEEAVLALAEQKGEAVQQQVAAEPDELRAPRLDLRPKRLLVRPARQAIHAIRADQQVIVAEVREVVDLALELQRDAQLAAAVLQDAEQPLARDPGDDMPAAAYLGLAVAHGDGVPDDEALRNRLVAGVVGLLEGGEGAVGEDDAPAIGRVGRVALDHANLGARVVLLEQQRGVESGGSRAQDRDLHDERPVVAVWRVSASTSRATTSASRSSCARSATAG